MVSNQREPPQNHEAEQSVLGSIILDPTEALATVQALGLVPGDFYSESHQKIYRAMIRLDEAGSTVDLVTLTEELRASGELDSVGSVAYLTGVADIPGVSSNVEDYGRIVLEHARRRDLERIGRRIQAEATKGEASSEELFGQAQDWLRSRAPTERARRPIRASEQVPKLPEPLLSAYGQGGALLVPGEVCLLSGAGGVAKSTLALTVALELAGGCSAAKIFHGQPCPVLVATFEDSADRVRWRLQRQAEVLETGQHWGKPTPTAALKRVHVLPLRGRPVHGPRELPGARSGSYTDRPVPLPGWWDLWRAVRETEARLVVLDPALGAFVGEANAAAPVREFLMMLAEEADLHDAGALLIAHSRKAARGGGVAGDDPGHVAGSTHWLDGVRGVLTLHREGEAGDRHHVLRVAKANYGPSELECRLTPITVATAGAGRGMPVAFKADSGGWTGLGAKQAGKERSAKGEPEARNPYG